MNASISSLIVMGLPLVCSRAAPNIDSHMSQPGHVAFGLWQTGPLHPSPQALTAVESCGVSDHLPLESLVSEPIANLDLHRQQ
jgi:hypothetical protein